MDMKYLKNISIAVFLIAFTGMATFSACASANENLAADNDDNTINALMITGGGWHDYENQKNVIADGLGERINITFTIDHSAGEDSSGEIDRHRDTAWAAQFDVVIYNMCFAGMRDVEWSQRIVNAHVENEVPAVMLHCALHSYNFQRDDDMWHKFAGLSTFNHQSHVPFLVESLLPNHPVMANLPKTWRTPHGELYNIEEEFDTATPLAHSYGKDTGKYHTNIWVNHYEGVRVFGTTIGHHTETMERDIYMNLVSAGVLWVLDKIEADGSPKSGYGKPAFGR